MVIKIKKFELCATCFNRKVDKAKSTGAKQFMGLLTGTSTTQPSSKYHTAIVKLPHHPLQDSTPSSSKMGPNQNVQGNTWG